MIFGVKILRFFVWKIFFKILSRQDEKTFFVQIFFYCLDYVSRLLKNCSEYSGKLKHASAVDSVSKLSLKNDRKPMNFSWKSCFMTIGFVRKSLVNREFCPFSERLCRLLMNWSHRPKSRMTFFFGFPNVPEVVFTRKNCLSAVTTVLHV